MPPKDPSRFPLGSRVTLDALDMDPYPVLSALRDREPVSWVPETGMWFVTRRADVLAVLRDRHRFTTASPRSTIQDLFGRHMLTTDGDEHLRYRRACLPPFRVKGLHTSVAPDVAARVDVLLEPLDRGRALELASEVAAPLALSSVMGVLGLPPEMAPRLREWYAHFARALANFQGHPEVRRVGQASVAVSPGEVGDDLGSLPSSAVLRSPGRALVDQGRAMKMIPPSTMSWMTMKGMTPL